MEQPKKDKKIRRPDTPLAATPEPIITRSESTDSKTGVTTYKSSWNESSPKKVGGSKDRVVPGGRMERSLQSLPKLTPAGKTFDTKPKASIK